MNDAIVSGLLGAVAAGFGKSGVDASVTANWSQIACNQPASEHTNPTGVNVARVIAYVTSCTGIVDVCMRLAFIGLMLAVNGAKMGYMIRGMASLGSAVFVAIDLVTGTVVGAIVDAVVFDSAPNWQWAAGIVVMTLGVYIVAVESASSSPMAPEPVLEQPSALNDAGPNPIPSKASSRRSSSTTRRRPRRSA